MGKSQSIQIAKYARFRRFTVRKIFSVQKAKGVAIQTFANALKSTKYHCVQSYRVGALKRLVV